MRRTLAVAVALTALAQPLLAQMGAKPGAKPGAAKAHGAQVVDEAVARAFKANDVDALAAAYAPDAVLYPPGAMEQRGRAAIRQGFADFLSHFRITDFTTADSHYETTGDLSVGWGRFTISALPKDGGGAPMRWEGRYSSVARRVGGKWLLVSDHASLPMGAPPQGPRPVSNPTR
jgi:uncharacterized protein (TIGR02246 family)